MKVESSLSQPEHLTNPTVGINMGMGIIELSTTINIIINIANINMFISGLKGIKFDRLFYCLFYESNFN